MNEQIKKLKRHLVWLDGFMGGIGFMVIIGAISYSFAETAKDIFMLWGGSGVICSMICLILDRKIRAKLKTP